ncbi:CDP-diacylglycerol--serine O-phosphatidyltransferase [Leadbetterella sp. DM7]|uniref:CDP-diacylglycerol--serine O-phosphatidyltransferase n=1 Tax=Leadbetterella sp. DM7 TaxID=3235085 RepID=UPI00349E8065
MRLFTISNFITLSNLLCGCLGILAVLNDGDLKKGGLLIGLALVFDFFDGFVARLLKESSELGKQLDSLADVVSFGVLPGFILWALVKDSGFLPQNTEYIVLLIPVFSALRLAKFNIDTRQSMSFIGLPTPANAMVIAVFPYLAENPGIAGILLDSWFLPVYVLVFSYLLVAEIPLPAMKFKNYSWQDNRFTYTLLILSVIALAVLKLAAVPLIIFGYILYSIIRYLRNS